MGKVRGWMKGFVGAVLGLMSGAGMMYLSVIVDTVVKPSKPVANFAVAAEGLTVNFQNHSSGESGWWDFGDGSPLEPFDAGQQTVAHTYPKPGSFTAKLTVRNFLMEENTRTVPVDLSAATPQTLPMSITGLQVEPVGAQAIAPATFRVRGEVQNAEKAILDLGDEKPEVITENGPFDRLVVIEKPGQFPIRLTGLSGKVAMQQLKTVTVSQPTAGSLAVVLRVTDTGTRVDRRETTTTIPVPVPAKGAKTFEKVVRADAGCTVTEARIGKLASPAVKNVKAEVAADKLSVKLTGDWAGDAKAAGGSDVLVPLTQIVEKTVRVNLPVQPRSASVTPGQPVDLALPPVPAGLTGHQRKMALEFRLATVTGATSVIQAVPDLKLPWTQAKTYPNVGTYTYKAEPAGDKVRLTVEVQASR
ncbi:MAG TPA: PKD domain-containing protein [Fimbriiglobus sp.]|jgi:PKD repeat protein|nr:PKD domain-containing protein [Fimbriiglobus sp.]